MSRNNYSTTKLEKISLDDHQLLMTLKPMIIHVEKVEIP